MRHAVFFMQATVSTLTRDIDIAILSVCPSVRNVPVFYGNDCHSDSFFKRYVAQSFWFYVYQTSSRNPDEIRWGIKISRFSTSKSLYFKNDIR